jgi:hypothetical protein
MGGVSHRPLVVGRPGRPSPEREPKGLDDRMDCGRVCFETARIRAAQRGPWAALCSPISKSGCKTVNSRLQAMSNISKNRGPLRPPPSQDEFEVDYEIHFGIQPLLGLSEVFRHRRE